MNPSEHWKELMEKHRLPTKILICYQCGACVGACPVANANPRYSPRRILEQTLLGKVDDLISSGIVWLCAYCHTCLEKCPQRVEVSEMLVDLKNIAARKGNIPPPLLERVLNIKEHGRSIPPSKAVERWRQRLNLPPLQPVGVEEVQEIIKATGLEALLEGVKQQEVKKDA